MKRGNASTKGKYQLLLTPLMTTLFMTQPVFAVTDPQEKINSAASKILGILTGLVVLAGGIACTKIVVKYLPVIDDPNEKNIMYKAITTALIVTALAGALVWLVPWAYNLLT